MEIDYHEAIKEKLDKLGISYEVRSRWGKQRIYISIVELLDLLLDLKRL